MMTDNAIVPLSDSDWQVFKFGEIEVHGKLDENGEPVFIASEVCAALGLANVSRALNALDPDEKLHITKRNETAGRLGILAVTESGLYHLVFKSQKEEAQTFKRWITHEVLPAIRKTGSYAVQNLTPAEIILVQAQHLVEIEREQRRQADDLNRLKAHVGIDKPNPYFTVREYAAYCKRHIGPRAEVKLGKQAARLCGVRHIAVEKVPNPDRAGNVNSYPEDVLQEVFNTWLVQDPLPEEGGAQ